MNKLRESTKANKRLERYFVNWMKEGGRSMAKVKTATQVHLESLQPANAEEARKRAEAEVQALVKVAPSVPKVITNQNELDFTTNFMQQVATTKRSVSQQEKSVTKLLDAAKRGIKSWFTPMHEKLDALREVSDGRILDYEEKLQAAAEMARQKELIREGKRLAALERAEEKKREAATSKAEAMRIKEEYEAKRMAVVDESDAALNQIVDEKPQMQGVSIVKRWQVAVLAIDEVPDYLVTKTLKTKDALDICREQVEQGREPNVRGLRFFQESGTAAKSF